jgi:signal transduction histidine kinase
VFVSKGVLLMCLTSTRDRQESGEKSELDGNMFLSMVSHELRTPTSAILGWAQLIKDRPADEATIAHGIEVIERNARLQARLIEQLLEFSRVNNGLLRLDAQRAALVPILEAAIDTMRPQAKAKEIDLHMELDAPAIAVICDPARLHQVITNLLANAIKFTPDGGRVGIRFARQGAYAEITVSDTGRGIPTEFLPHIFEPFRQAGTDQATAHDGLGLGLTIARHIIERHEGKIHAESLGEGMGTKFTITLPLEEEPASVSL